MKQQITVEQLNELSPKAKEKLMGLVDRTYDRKVRKECSAVITTHWHEDKNYLLSIGQMIEFLDKHIDSDICSLAIDRGQHQWHVYVIESIAVKAKPSIVTPELCDALWEAVKESLE